MRLVSSLVVTHKHSPGDAEQGEDYPHHLKEVVALCAKLIQSAEVNPNISKENYDMQDRIVGIDSPIGTKTTASPRGSTRDGNNKAGHQLVERVKDASAYSDVMECSPVPKLKTSNNKKKPKTDVRGLIKKSNDSRSDMANAVIDLSKSCINEKTSKEELQFKKEVWNDKKLFQTEKMQIDHEYRTSKNSFQYDENVLKMLKSNRDDAISKYKNESDEEIKVLYKSDFTSLSKLYTDKMAEVCRRKKKGTRTEKRSNDAISVNDSNDSTSDEHHYFYSPVSKKSKETKKRTAD